MIVVLFAATKFDAVKKPDGTQKYKNLDECVKDVEIIDKIFQNYPISEEDVTYKLIDDTESPATVE